MAGRVIGQVNGWQYCTRADHDLFVITSAAGWHGLFSRVVDMHHGIKERAQIVLEVVAGKSKGNRRL